MSYLLTGVTATGDDGHTAHFHDCSKTIPVSISGRRGVQKQKAVKDEGEQSNVHFIVKVPVSGSKVDGVVVVVLRSCRLEVLRAGQPVFFFA